MIRLCPAIKVRQDTYKIKGLLIFSTNSNVMSVRGPAFVHKFALQKRSIFKSNY
jgi:hypothetical protein